MENNFELRGFGLRFWKQNVTQSVDKQFHFEPRFWELCYLNHMIIILPANLIIIWKLLVSVSAGQGLLIETNETSTSTHSSSCFANCASRILDIYCRQIWQIHLSKWDKYILHSLFAIGINMIKLAHLLWNLKLRSILNSSVSLTEQEICEEVYLAVKGLKWMFWPQPL